ncbi:RpiB/LacA/LacB family sugar-phosphate isomerase [Candidatus Saccharibacteria bacterium]|nr:RpiB/LacA/LacB family sugar-phosphate isomerase [Candidatus Saccharibacteria bacterium]
MKVYIGADHRGLNLKEKIFAYLSKRGYKVEDVNDKELKPDEDFPQIAQAAALKLFDEEPDLDRAILICSGGQGMAIAANRFRGVRAIVATTAEDARYGRIDIDANALNLSTQLFDIGDDQYWQDIIDTFLNTDFSGAARFVRRNQQLDELA